MGDILRVILVSLYTCYNMSELVLLCGYVVGLSHQKIPRMHGASSV